MKIKQLGNGGGLDYNKTNSSFMIEYQRDSFLLVDCGYNIFAKLCKMHDDENDPFDLTKLTDVYITHNHDDHIGSLTALIFHQYFMNGVVLNIRSFKCNSLLNTYLSTLCNTELVGGVLVKSTMYNLSLDSTFKISNDNCTLIRGNHQVIESWGIHIGGKTYVSDPTGVSIFISGDTKASEIIETDVLKASDPGSRVMILHDFSLWNAVSKNVHACENDVAIEYSNKFKEAMYKYHTGLDFNEDWVDVDNDDNVRTYLVEKQWQ